MQTLDLSCFFGKIVLGDDGSQNIIVYEPTLNTLNLKEDKKYIVENQKGQILKPLYIAFLHGIKPFVYKMRIKFDKDPLVLEQNNYVAKIENAYIVYGLDSWSNIPLNNFKLKSSLLMRLIQ